MKIKDLDYICKIIRASGIGTKVQREAIVQRIIDAYMELKDRKGHGYE